MYVCLCGRVFVLVSCITHSMQLGHLFWVFHLVFNFFRIENIFPCKFHFAMVLFLVICSGGEGGTLSHEISLLTFLMFIYWLMWEG